MRTTRPHFLLSSLIFWSSRTRGYSKFATLPPRSEILYPPLSPKGPAPSTPTPAYTPTSYAPVRSNGNNCHNTSIMLRARRDFLMNEARTIFTTLERTIYCKGSTAWNSLPPTERNLPCHEAFKHRQKRNLKEITKNLPVF